MKRRTVLAACLSLMPVSLALAASRKRFVFKVKTKSGGIVIEAKDIEAANYKLRKQHPGCEIMKGHEEK